MTDLRKAAEMALEFLEHVDRFDPNGRYGLDEKIDALIQALAQPEQDHGFDRTASHMAGEYVDTAQHEQSSAMDEWRSMVVVNLLPRCPNLSKHELCELAAHFESRLPVAQPEALRLAEVLELFHRSQDSGYDNHTISLTDSIVAKSAVELRRLHQANQELAKALKGFVEMGRGFDMDDIRRGREILAKYKEQA